MPGKVFSQTLFGCFHLELSSSNILFVGLEYKSRCFFHTDDMGSFSEDKTLRSTFFLFGENGNEIEIIFDLPFTYLMRNFSGHAMSPDSTVLVYYNTRTRKRCISACEV